MIRKIVFLVTALTGSIVLLLGGCRMNGESSAEFQKMEEAMSRKSASATLTEASIVHVVTADAPTPTATFAAAEFARCIKAILGCRAEVFAESACPKNDSAYVVYVGPSRWTEDVVTANLPPEHFIMRTGTNCLYLVGHDDEVDPLAVRFRARTGTLYAVYVFLRRHAGARWLWPGELGEVLPETDRLVIPSLNVQEGPAMSVRLTYYGFGNVHTGADRTAQVLWGRRNGLGAARRGDPRHSSSRVVGEKYFDDHPEYYALVGGERRNLRKYGKLCHSNPALPAVYAQWAEETVNWDVVSTTANDGRSWCECDRCQLLDALANELDDPANSPDYPPTSGRMFTFANRVARELTRRGNQKPVYIAAYADYLRPPPNINRLEDNVVVFIARGMKWNRNPADEEIFRDMFQEWQKKASRIVLRGYPDNNSPMSLSPYPRLAHRYMRFMYDRIASFEGVNFSGDDSRDYALSGPTKYVIARLAWNPLASLENVLDEYYRAGWPGGHEHVKAYFDFFEYRLDRICAEHKARFGGWNANGAELMPVIYDKESMDKAAAWLDHADAAALSDKEQKRVEFLRVGLKMVRRETAYWKALLDLAAIGEPLGNIPVERHETVSIAERHKRILAAQEAMITRQNFIDEHAHSQAIPSIIFHQKPERLTGRWDNVIRNLARLELQDNPNRLLLRDPWKFRLDPDAKGHAERWFRKDLILSQWTDIRTKDVWENQGYGREAYPENRKHGYNGWGWYRTTFSIPNHDGIRKAILTLGAVDESYDVWVNGNKAASFRYNPDKNRNSWKEPQNIEITPFIESNAENQLTVAVLDTSGVGGIWQPCTVTFETSNLIKESITSWHRQNAAFEKYAVDGEVRDVLILSPETEFPVKMTTIVGNIEPGARYRFTLRIKPLECDFSRRTKYDKLLGVRIYGRNAAGKALPQSTYLHFGIPTPQTETPGVWIPLSQTFEAPANTHELVISVDLRQYGVYLFDQPALMR